MIGFVFFNLKVWSKVQKKFRVQQIIVVHYSFDSYFSTNIAPV